MQNEDAYKANALNSQLFSGKIPHLSDYFKSTTHFLNKSYFRDGDSFLDVGGGGGDFAYAILSEVAKINATIIDPDAKCLEIGRKNYPQFSFIEGFFPNALATDEKFDIVSMQALFPQIPDWKEMLLALKARTKRFLNISLTLKLSGTTIVDKDISYFYYLDSGVRVHQVIHNLYELVNFLCIHEMGVKKIEFYGYHTPYVGHNFRSVPNSEQIKGNLMIEFFENEIEAPKRMGGAVDKGKGVSDYKFFIPEMNFNIDGSPFNPRT